jgi:hypothetical protein
MTRWIVVSGLALALVLPLVGEAVADGMAPRKAVYTKKRCIAPAMWWGRGQTTWVCTAAQKCCYDRLLRKGTCLDATARCF